MCVGVGEGRAAFLGKALPGADFEVRDDKVSDNRYQLRLSVGLGEIGGKQLRVPGVFLLIMWSGATEGCGRIGLGSDVRINARSGLTRQRLAPRMRSLLSGRGNPSQGIGHLTRGRFLRV